MKVILQHGIIRVCQLRLRGAWLHGLCGCMRGTEIYIFHGFQVVRSARSRNEATRALTEKPPPHGKHCFLSEVAEHEGLSWYIEKIQNECSVFYEMSGNVWNAQNIMLIVSVLYIY